MKVASISPQFIFEPPAGEKDAEAEKATDALGLKLVRTEKPAEAADSDKLDSETREGLKRLSQLIRKNRKTPGSKREFNGDQKKKRALLLYRNLSEVRDPRAGRGENLDEYI